MTAPAGMRGAQLQKLLAAAPDSFLLLRPDMTIAEVSDAYLRATGTRREDIVGRPLSGVLTDGPAGAALTGRVQDVRPWPALALGAAPASDVGHSDDAVGLAGQTGDPDMAEVNRQFHHANMTLLRLCAELRTEQAHLLARTATLEHANRNLASFDYSVAHDLRAPLRAIDGFSRVLLEDHAAQLDESGRHLLERVCCGSKRMSDLIDALLMLADCTRRPLQRTLVDISALALDVAADLAQASPERERSSSTSPRACWPGPTPIWCASCWSICSATPGSSPGRGRAAPSRWESLPAARRRCSSYAMTASGST